MNWPDHTVLVEGRAPAKVNLWLQVGGRRPDGMHAVRSLTVAVTLADRVQVWYKPDRDSGSSVHRQAASTRPGSVLCRGPVTLRVVGASGLEMEDNLCLQAARWWMARFGEPDGQVEIVLHKEIPIAVGLGGGSSDAAAVLRALSRIVRQSVDSLEMREVAELGSDVPFCLSGRPAVLSGMGEQLDFRRVAVSALCLVRPGWSWATPAAYAALDALRSGDDAPDGFGAEPAIGWNDFWPLARRRKPGLADIRGRLEKTGASATGMSGKGPLLFGTYETSAQARRTAALLNRQGLWARAVEVIPSVTTMEPGLQEGPRP